ncbi:MAG: helix-turn-helix domain-containing protein [Candidatus Eremiobacteraeota bacterium]|nr:helix-turn-helix domain-containing protein [Candidatus Eremiobacteraeota bacterium]
MIKYSGIVHNDPDGLWIEFPDFPELSGTQGDTMEELIMMAEDCLGGYIEYLLEQGRDIPEPSKIEDENIIYIQVPVETAIPLIYKKARKEMGLTQGEVASRMGVTYRAVQNIERKKRSPSIKTLTKIAKALGKKLVVELI